MQALIDGECEWEVRLHGYVRSAVAAVCVQAFLSTYLRLWAAPIKRIVRRVRRRRDEQDTPLLLTGDASEDTAVDATPILTLRSTSPQWRPEPSTAPRNATTVSASMHQFSDVVSTQTAGRLCSELRDFRAPVFRCFRLKRYYIFWMCFCWMCMGLWWLVFSSMSDSISRKFKSHGLQGHVSGVDMIRLMTLSYANGAFFNGSKTMFYILRKCLTAKGNRVLQLGYTMTLITSILSLFISFAFCWPYIVLASVVLTVSAALFGFTVLFEMQFHVDLQSLMVCRVARGFMAKTLSRCLRSIRWFSIRLVIVSTVFATLGGPYDSHICLNTDMVVWIFACLFGAPVLAGLVACCFKDDARYRYDTPPVAPVVVPTYGTSMDSSLQVVCVQVQAYGDELPLPLEPLATASPASTTRP